MKLMDILLEDKGDKTEKPQKPKPQVGASPGVQQSVDRMINRFAKEPEKPKLNAKPNDKIPSLKQIAKDIPSDNEEDPALAGFPKFKNEPEENPFGNPDFTMPKTREKGSYPTRFSPKSTEKPVKFEPESDPSVPSLAQLAKDAEEAEPEQPPPPEGDPALAGLPQFNADSSEWNPNPFGTPNLQEPPDTRIGLQKGIDAFKQGFNKLRGNPMTPEPGAQAAQSAQDMNWSPDQQQGQAQQAPQQPAQDPQDPGMPQLKSLTGKQAGRGMGGKHWKWKPGQKVDIGFIKDLTVLGVDQFGAKLQAKNGGIYRFIPHKGLRKIG